MQLTGPEDKIEAFIELCRPYGIKQLSRTGVIAVPRSNQPETTAAAVDSRSKRVRTATVPAGKIDEPALPPS
jgi:acetolactate synthase-1/3 small subunit